MDDRGANTYYIREQRNGKRLKVSEQLASRNLRTLGLKRDILQSFREVKQQLRRGGRDGARFRAFLPARGR